MLPKLYQYTACPFCHKVRATLDYKKVAYEAIEVHPLNKKEIGFSADYRAVPIYIDSTGQQVNDSTPIMQHIDKEFPELRIFSDDELQKIKDEKWLAWSQTYVKGLPTVIYDTLPNALRSFNYITKIGNFSWFQKCLIKYSGALIMTLVAKKIKKRENIVDPTKFLTTKMEEWCVGLEGNPFMGGDAPSASDLAVYGITNSIIDLKAGDQIRGHREFFSWINRINVLIKKPLAVISN